ncbi:DUF2079 domain-containing protein [Streptomyces sp. H39-C1]|uniref:DUF2079 domain-containing protein n=1 Tax=Streptomyces sp. H39-C1 TaxID=3004355 RepID=UPI0022AF6255|nr:DUF2079 domain-containing protein [Streptomyces sp. H39-C1]MCZ4098918.1 DUF2079 domain-containing protein [Streptomyces sp. H39-C1]
MAQLVASQSARESAAAAPIARQRDRIRTVALTVLCFAAVLAVGLQQWVTVRIGGFDLGIFDQAVRAYSHFQLPRSPIKNYHHEFPPGFSLLGDHFSPVLALLAPLYWVWDDPRMLIGAQAALFAAGVPVVRRIAGHCFAEAPQATVRRAADLSCLVHGLGWPLLRASGVGFHEVAFAVPLTLLMLERGLARRYGAVLVCAVLLCCTKEDLGLLAAAYGAVLIGRGRRDGDRPAVRTGLTLFVLGPVAALLAIRVLIPAMGGVPGYYWNYSALGPDMGSAALRFLTDPIAAFAVTVDHSAKPVLLLWLLGPLLLLPLGSATFWCAVPLLAERLFSDNPSHWATTHHYDAFLWPVLLVAAVETAARLHRRHTGRPVARWTLVAVACSLLVSVVCGLGNLLLPAAWTPSPSERALAEGVRLVPAGATVEADNNAAPRLTRRAQVVIADETPRDAEYVLLQTVRKMFPFTTVDDQRDRVLLLLDNGYTVLWAKDGVVLLHRTDPGRPVPGARVPGDDSVPVKEPEVRS